MERNGFKLKNFIVFELHSHKKDTLRIDLRRILKYID